MYDFSQRDPAPGVDDLFWQRWSPRTFDGAPLADEVITRLVDAARWAPSCYNEQPWRFHTSTPDTFDQFLALLVEGNQAWARTASMLGFIVVKRHFDRNGALNTHARFDAGSAWMALTLQARLEGLYSHGLGGIHYERVAEYLALDTERFEVVMGFAIGRPVEPTQLDSEQRHRETPNSRIPLTAMWQAH